MKQPEALTSKQFEDLLDVYGADIESWPETLQAPAISLLGISDDAVRALEEARRLGAWLDGAESVEPSLQLLSAVRSVPARFEQRGLSAFWPLQSLYKTAFGLALASLMGFVTGSIILPAQDAQPDATQTAATGQTWESFGELAFAESFASEDFP